MEHLVVEHLLHIHVHRQSDIGIFVDPKLNGVGKIQAAGFRAAPKGAHQTDGQLLAGRSRHSLPEESFRIVAQHPVQQLQVSADQGHLIFDRHGIVPGLSLYGLFANQNADTVALSDFLRIGPAVAESLGIRLKNRIMPACIDCLISGRMDLRIPTVNGFSLVIHIPAQKIQLSRFFIRCNVPEILIFCQLETGKTQTAVQIIVIQRQALIFRSGGCYQSMHSICEPASGIQIPGDQHPGFLLRNAEYQNLHGALLHAGVIGVLFAIQ